MKIKKCFLMFTLLFFSIIKIPAFVEDVSATEIGVVDTNEKDSKIERWWNVEITIHRENGEIYTKLYYSDTAMGKDIPKYDTGGASIVFMYYEYEKDGKRIKVTDDTIFTEDTDLYPVCSSLGDGVIPDDMWEKSAEELKERMTRKAARSLLSYKPVISSAKNNKKKTITVKVELKHSDEGFEIQYSTSKKFKNAKRITIKPNGKKLYKKITKLKKGKTYYVRVRTYRIYLAETGNTDSEIIYSKWSKEKKVKIKK